MNDLLAMATKLTGTAQWWLINDIVHSWVDPLYGTAIAFAVGYVFYRGARWLYEDFKD